MTPPTVDQLIQRYCECARSLWNNYLRSSEADEAALERYDEVRALLFRAIVLDAIGMGDAERDREDQTWPFLRVSGRRGIDDHPREHALLGRQSVLGAGGEGHGLVGRGDLVCGSVRLGSTGVS